MGWWLGTIVSWIGMSLGAVIGFGLAKRWVRVCIGIDLICRALKRK